MRMLRSYRKPSMVVYSRNDVLELIGPAKTQYMPAPPPCVSCEVQISPDEFIQVKPNQTMQLTVDTQGCTEFQQVRIKIPGEPDYVFMRAEGAIAGGKWVVSIPGLQFHLPPGDYSVNVTLVDGQGNESPSCEAIFTVVL